MYFEANMDPNPESQQQPRQEQQQQQQQQLQQQEGARPSVADSEDDILPELIQEPIGSGSVLFDRVHQMMEKFAATRIGQYVLERGDRVLRTIEDTVKWSLPQDQAAVPLVRPLPWIPFLVLIIFLRQLRIWLSLAALFIGNDPVTPHTLIYFIQTRRRKLRSIRINGMKAIQQEAADRKAMKPEYDNKFMVNLCKIFTIARCRPRLGCQPAGIVFSADNPANRGLLRPMQSGRYKYKRGREDDDPIREFAGSRLMEKFSDLTSDDDTEYLPKESELVVESSNDESTLSANISTSDTQGEYSMNTSGENVQELSPDECEETDENKSLKKNETTKNETTEEKNTPNVENKETTEVKKKSKTPEKKVSAEVTSKPSEENIIPKIEISGTEEKNNSPTKLKDQSDKQEGKVSPSSDNTVTASPKTPISPQDNGQSKSGINDYASEAEALIANAQAPKSQKEQIFNLLNGHKDEQKKATPGHESAADTKPHIPPLLLSSTSSTSSSSSSGSVLVNANPTDENFIDANDAACFAKQIVKLTNKSSPPPPPTTSPLLQPTTPPQPTSPFRQNAISPQTQSQPQPQPQPQPEPQQQPQSSFSSPSSPSCSSTTSSSSSLASFTSSDECVVNADYSDAPTPTPSLNAASSTEDVYLSPIGSPDFSTFHKPPTKQQKPTASVETDSSARDEVEDDDNDDDEHSQHTKQQRSQPAQQRTGHHQQQQHNYKANQRFRKNRR